MIEDFKVCCRQKLEPKPRNGMYLSAAVCDSDNDEVIVSGLCPGHNIVHEIILFTGKFEGRPVIGGMFVCENETKVVECVVTKRLT